MKSIYDVILETSVGVIAIVFLCIIVTNVLLGVVNMAIIISNAVVYLALIIFYIRNSLRGVKKGGSKKES